MDLGLGLLLATLATLLYVYYRTKTTYSYWEKKGLPCAEGFLPWLGHALPLLLIRKNLGGLISQIYKSASHYSMIGFYMLDKPNLIVRDPELVKSVVQSNFASFAKNDLEVDEKNEPLLFRNPFFCWGEQWKMGRTRLASAFTGNKLRILSEAIKDVCHKYTDYMEKEIRKNKDAYEVEMKSSLARLTGEIVATTGFSIEGHCFEDPIKPRTFREITQAVFADDLYTQLKILTILYCPALLGLFDVKFFPRKFELFFEKVCRSNIETRKNGFQGMDFMQMMIEQENKESNDIDEVNKAVTAHMASYFVDMYETTSLVLSYVVHELSIHKEIQGKVREEIRAAVAKTEGCLTIDTINEMPYMDQVINETLRLHPVVYALMKRCTETIELTGSDGLKCVVDPETTVYIPVEGLHMDPLYWENPRKFDPERFRPEAVNSRHKYVYIPFNEGPRNCPGRRVARTVMKIALSMILMKYSVELSPKTKMPLQYKVLAFMTYAKSGLWVIMRPLSKKDVIE